MYDSNQSFVDSAAWNASGPQSSADAASFTQYIIGTDAAWMYSTSSADKYNIESFIGAYKVTVKAKWKGSIYRIYDTIYATEYMRYAICDEVNRQKMFFAWTLTGPTHYQYGHHVRKVSGFRSAMHVVSVPKFGLVPVLGSR